MTSTPPERTDFIALLEAEIERKGGQGMSSSVCRDKPSSAAEHAYRPRYESPSSLGIGELILVARELRGITQPRLAASARTSLTVVEAAGFEVVIGIRDPDRAEIVALGLLQRSQDDGLANFVPITMPSVFAGQDVKGGGLSRRSRP